MSKKRKRSESKRPEDASGRANEAGEAGEAGEASEAGQAIHETTRATLRFGWTAVAVFMLGGLTLESLHLFKLPFYLEATLRRELWTLAHAHGTLLGVMTIALGLTMRARRDQTRQRQWTTASQALRASAILMPCGFFLGGVGNAEGDPSLFIALVPIGALLAIFAAVRAAAALRR